MDLDSIVDLCYAIMALGRQVHKPAMSLPESNTDERYQVQYLPHFTVEVDNYPIIFLVTALSINN